CARPQLDRARHGDCLTARLEGPRRVEPLLLDEQLRAAERRTDAGSRQQRRHALAEGHDRTVVAHRKELAIAPERRLAITQRLARQGRADAVEIVAGVEHLAARRTDPAQLIGALAPPAGGALEMRQPTRRRPHEPARLADHTPPTIRTTISGATPSSALRVPRVEPIERAAQEDA